MDFVGMFAQMAEDKQFQEKVKAKFELYCSENHIPPAVRSNHAFTWDKASKAGAVVLAELVGETMAAHPYLAKQAAKLLGDQK